MVEFALTFPLLVMLLFGMFSGGILLDRQATISQSAREGARYGATIDPQECDPTTQCGGRTWAELVQDHTFERASGEVTESEICVALVTGPGSSPSVFGGTSHYSTNGSSPCYVDNSADEGTRVQVSISTPDEFDAIFVKVSVTLSTEATTKFEEL